MNALQVSSQIIKFTYNSKGHLQSTITIKNNHEHHSYFKFKVTRPKYYLIKPDHGFCDAKTSTNIAITLHQQGVNQGQTDKLKVYFKNVGKEHIEPMRGWEKQQPEASSIRFPILIQGLPQQYKRLGERAKTSEVKSLANSKFDQTRTPSNAALQASLRQKQSRLNHLRTEVDLLKKGAGKLQNAPEGTKQYILAAVLGLIVGLLTSYLL